MKAGLSQRALSTLTDISQASISYYERSLVVPGDEQLAKLARALAIPLPRQGAPDAPHEQTTADEATGAALTRLRADLHKRLVDLPEKPLLLDRPGREASGDLALAIDMQSHVFYALIDGVGNGPKAAQNALMGAAALLGAAASRDQGVLWPEVALWAVGALAGHFSRRVAECCCVLIDRRHRIVFFGRTSFPPPWLKSGDAVHQLVGKKGARGGFSVGEMRVKAKSTLLMATDGLANLATKAGRAFWEGEELQRMLRTSRSPGVLLSRLEKRLTRLDKDENALALVLGL